MDDNRAADRRLSGVSPLRRVDRSIATRPAFVLDLVPQGRQAERIAKFDLPPGAPTTEIHLLRRSAGSPVGNTRIKEAHELEVGRIGKMPRIGVTMDDVLKRSDAFIEVADRFSMLASGSNGLQGDWPKVALTQAKDRLWYPNPMVEDDDARAHVIVKLLRSGDP